MKTIDVVAREDHIERISQIANPVFAIEELIWNSLDADSTEVSVNFDLNELGGISSICVTDNGTSIQYKDAENFFRNIGGSWKRTASRTVDKKRFLHGKLGQGRFKSFSLGSFVQWDCVYKRDGETYSYSIIADKSMIGKCKISDEVATPDKKCGTIVTISGVTDAKAVLLKECSVEVLEERLMLYLNDYVDVSIHYNGSKLNPARLVSKHFAFEVPALEVEPGKYIHLSGLILELCVKRERSLCLCDDTGFVLEKRKPGFHAPGFSFVVYVKSEYIRELYDSGQLLLDELHPGLKCLLNSVKTHAKDYFRKRSAEEATNLIETWKSQKIYPYAGEASNEQEIIERQIFDLLALNVNEYLPDFEEASDVNKKFSLQLIREALERNPTALQRILESVLELPEDKIQELNELLSVTSLSSVITASKCVADRLSFIHGLEVLLFEHTKYFKERTQLHKLLARNTWIFGEEFALSVNDQSLNNVLEKHLKLLGRDVLADDSIVKVEGQSSGIVDMMLSRKIPQPRSEKFVHLVVELKRPSQSIDSDVRTQIEKYAYAVAADSRFSKTDTVWEFWTISNTISDSVLMSTQQANRPEGILLQAGNITIWALTWAQVLRNCKARLNFFQQNLRYEPDTEASIEFLKKTYEQYLPKSIR